MSDQPNETLTKRQIASRENGKLGGVKTPEGKSRSKYNAYKHGLFAKRAPGLTEDSGYRASIFSPIANRQCIWSGKAVVAARPIPFRIEAVAAVGTKDKVGWFNQRWRCWILKQSGLAADRLAPG